MENCDFLGTMEKHRARKHVNPFYQFLFYLYRQNNIQHKGYESTDIIFSGVQHSNVILPQEELTHSRNNHNTNSNSIGNDLLPTEEETGHSNTPTTCVNHNFYLNSHQM